MTEPIWKDVKGYEDFYKINKTGEVYSNHSKRKLKPYKSSDGYLRVNLSKNSKVKITMVHRLVAESFIPNPHNYPVVNHIDGNKANPDISNLEWTSHSGNSKHAYERGLSKISDKNRRAVSKIAAENGAKTTRKAVLQFDLEGRIVREFPSIKEASRQTKTNDGNISLVCKGKYKHAGGFIWKYKEVSN